MQAQTNKLESVLKVVIDDGRLRIERIDMQDTHDDFIVMHDIEDDERVVFTVSQIDHVIDVLKSMKGE